MAERKHKDRSCLSEARKSCLIYCQEDVFLYALTKPEIIIMAGKFLNLQKESSISSKRKKRWGQVHIFASSGHKQESTRDRNNNLNVATVNERIELTMSTSSNSLKTNTNTKVSYSVKLNPLVFCEVSFHLLQLFQNHRLKRNTEK